MERTEFHRVERRIVRLATLTAGLGVLFWIKGLALGAGIGVVGVAGMVALEHASQWSRTVNHDPASAPAIAPAPTRPVAAPAPAESSTSDDAEVEVEEQAATDKTTLALPIRDSGTDATTDTLAHEVALVQRAQGALATNPAQALAFANEHASRFPRGQMVMEREILAVEALKRLGRESEAQARATALLRTAKGSLYEERVRNLIPEASQ